jgi:glucosamine--fructose-6-phosphate aminotransferase (isomerizing)
MEPIARRLAENRFNRIVLTGMGASYTVSYPAWVILSQLGLPASLLETSELIHYAPRQIDDNTLLWGVSQSGRSAEIQQLVQQVSKNPVGAFIGVTNEADSPLGQAGDPVLQLLAGEEATVSSRTYLNALAVLLLAAVQLVGGDVEQARGEMVEAANAIENYLANWQEHVAEVTEMIGYPRQLMVVGRGPSLAAALTSSFMQKEAAKYACEGMSSAQFRHGPLELAAPGFALVVYEGQAKTARMNRELALEVAGYGGKVAWVSTRVDPDLPTLQIPRVSELTLPFVEILPLQMLSLSLAQHDSIEPGKFRHISKVTIIQ